MISKNKFSKFITALYGAFPGKHDLSDTSMEIMYQALKGEEFDQLRQAGIDHLRLSKFAPSVSELMDAIHGSQKDMAMVALAILKRAIPRIGSMSSARFADPCIHFAIEAMGGWRDVCLSESKMFDRQFIDYYIIALKRNIAWDDVPKILACYVYGNMAEVREVDAGGNVIKRYSLTCQIPKALKIEEEDE